LWWGWVGVFPPPPTPPNPQTPIPNPQNYYISNLIIINNYSI
jgi:hypothetical protein